MPLARSHWLWFALVLSAYSVWDWYDHISRPGSSFEEFPGAWFGFTFASTLGVWFVAWVSAKALERARLPEILAATIGVALAAAAHLIVLGPLWDRLFWDGLLMFDSVATPAAIAAGLYLGFRALFALFATVLGSPPSSRA